MTGTIYHDLCPICGNRTVDTTDGECKYAYCGQPEHIEQPLVCEIHGTQYHPDHYCPDCDIHTHDIDNSECE